MTCLVAHVVQSVAICIWAFTFANLEMRRLRSLSAFSRPAENGGSPAKLFNIPMLVVNSEQFTVLYGRVTSSHSSCLLRNGLPPPTR